MDSLTVCSQDFPAHCSPRGKAFQKPALPTIMVVSCMAVTASKFRKGPTEFLKKCSRRHSVNKILYSLNHKKFQKRNSCIKGVMKSLNILKFHILKFPSLKSVKLELHTIARRVMIHHRAFKIISPYRTAYFEYHRHNIYSKNQKI